MRRCGRVWRFPTRPGADVPGVGAPASDAGASEAQEIGYVLSVGLLPAGAHRRRGGLTSPIPDHPEVTVDVFATVAKIRALRHCWATVLENMGQPIDSTQIVAVSAHRWLTQADPLSTSCAAQRPRSGAVVGGADAVTLAPFDSATLAGCARATSGAQHPAGSAGRIRASAGASTRLAAVGTSRRSPTSWPQPPGGSSSGSKPPTARWTPPMRSVRTSQWWPPAATRTSRPKASHHRVSEFPLLDERAPTRRLACRTPVRRSLTGPTHEAAPWPQRRLAQPHEDLRANAADATVFLANLGPKSVHTRGPATFATNLFAAGGCAPVNGTGPRRRGVHGVRCRHRLHLLVRRRVRRTSAEDTAERTETGRCRRVYLAGKGRPPA